MSTYYLDANALLKYYGKGGKGKPVLRRLLSRQIVIISALTQVEFIHALTKEVRRKTLRMAEVRHFEKRLHHETSTNPAKTNRPFIYKRLPKGVYKRAQILLMQYGDSFDFGTLDALHIAITEKLREDYPDIKLVTSDGSMKRVCTRIHLATYDPEKDPPP
jgi:predicted nucleic acid-binding protein